MVDVMKNDDRVHACLDGEIPRDDLSATERAALAEMERALGRVAAVVGTGSAVDFRQGVMNRLDALYPEAELAERPQMERAWRWLWLPRQVSFHMRPALALAAGVLLLVAPLAVFPAGSPGEDPFASESAAPVMLVQFRLDAAGASSVSLAGTFSEWEAAVELRQSGPGVWTAMVPLPHGVHDYLFLVDGREWMSDPLALEVDDDFGGVNSRLLLTPPGSHL
jgi:hypothetical protein